MAYDIPQDVFPALPEVTVLRGPVGSGKTERLRARVIELLEGGCAPQDVLVICPTAVSAQDFSLRLARCTQEGTLQKACKHVAVASTSQVAARVIADGADDRQGRPPRLLTPYELQVFRADLAPLGIEPARLDQILLFLDRSWSDLAHWNPDWLITREEKDLVSLVCRVEQAMGGIIPSRACARALDALRASDALRERHAFRHVLMDDMLMQTRAAQVMAATLARASLTVCVDETAAGTTTLEAHPYATGLSELLEANADAQVIDMPSCGKALPLHDVEACGYPSAGDELTAVADAVCAWIDGGTPASDVCVAAAHPTWRANIEMALADRGVAATTLPLTRVFDNPGAYGALGDTCSRALALLLLAANPHDGAALRCWLGMGDHLQRAGEVFRMREEARSRGAALEELLDETADGKILALESACPSILDAYAMLKDLLAQVPETSAGEDLLEVICTLAVRVDASGNSVPEKAELAQRACDALYALCLPDREATAESMARSCLAAFTDPTFPQENSPAVRLCGPAEAWGLATSHVCVAGCMDGFLPRPDVFEDTVVKPAIRARMLEADSLALRSLMGNAKFRRATFTERMPDADADRLGLVVGRIRMEGGVKTAVLRRSTCLNEEPTMP